MKKPVLAVVSLLLSSVFSYGQSLPEIPRDNNIHIGTLPNGLTYYIATNKASHGYADYVIVQKKALDVQTASEALAELPLLGGIAPFEFLAKKGVGYGPEGYFTSDGKSSLFRFTKVPTSDVAASDTTLMMLFGLCDLSPYEQAIVVSGDVDVSNLTGKMSIFSLMVGPRAKAPESEPYEWKPSQGVQYESELLSPGRYATFSVTYRTSRIPDEQLRNARVLVNERLYSELSVVLRNHIRVAFRKQGIALANVDTRYRDSAASTGDETFTVSITVAAEDLQDAASALSEVLYCLDTRGIDISEMPRVIRESEAAMAADAVDFVSTNRYYVDKCVASYLYGTHLGAHDAAYRFFSQKSLPVEVEHSLLCEFASALIDPEVNVKLSVSSPRSTYSKAEMASLYQSSWNSADSELKFSWPDSTFRVETPKRVKLKAETPEPLSGGEMWTFSNGIKVIFKHLKNSPALYYSLLVKGGYSDLKGLVKGEGPYLSDALKMMKVGGRTPLEFESQLRANGIFMDMEVSLADMRLFGTAPPDGIGTLMSALLTVASSRSVDRDNFEYYKQCERLRLDVSRKEQSGFMAVVDGITRPDFPYSPFKTEDGLTDALPDRALTYTDRQFSKVNDGVLILMGDIEPTELKKELCKYLGGFDVGKGLSVRPDIMYAQKNGWSNFTMQGDEDMEGSVNVAMSTIVPVSAKRYMAFKVAELIFSRELAGALKRYGMWTEIEDNVEFLPTERLSMLITCHPTQGDGLPAGVKRKSLSAVLPAVRVAVELACTKPITQDEMKSYKALLLNHIGYDKTLNRNIMQMMMLRYSQGKDLLSGYKDAIAGLTPEDIREVLNSLNESSKVEFIVK